MKKPLFATFVALAIWIGGFARSAQADVSFDFFYDSLSPYGNWVEIGDYGYCWHPDGVDDDWAPYSDGYWAYTDAGWTWVSYEDFGAITYHYGRWVDVDDVGWCWVPGEEWAPAWVSWRSSDDYIGWAPLPPRAIFTASIGFSTWVDREYDIGPRYYNFCEFRNFGSPALRPVIINRSRNVTIINHTVNITNITVRGDRNLVYVGGPRFDVVSRRSARPIQTLRLVQRTDFDPSDRRADRLLARQQGNQLIVAAPAIRKSEGDFKPQKVARVIQTPKIDTGWNKIKDPKVKKELRAKMETQSAATPKDAPAKPVDEAEVKVVEERIKAQPATAGASEEVVGGKKGKEGKQHGAAGDVGAAPSAGPETTGESKIGKADRKNRQDVSESPAPSPSAIDQPSPAATETGKAARKNRKGVSEAVTTPRNAAEATAPEATAGAPDSSETAKPRKKAGARELQPFTPQTQEPVARKERKVKPADAGTTDDGAAAAARQLERQRRAAAMQENALQQQQAREALRQQNILKQQAKEERRQQIESQQEQKIRSFQQEQPRVRERAVPQQRIQQAPPRIQPQTVPQTTDEPAVKEKGKNKKNKKED